MLQPKRSEKDILFDGGGEYGLAQGICAEDGVVAETWMAHKEGFGEVCNSGFNVLFMD